MSKHNTETVSFLTLDETKRLFAVITNRRDKAIFLLAYRHGLRASEVGLLQVSDIDFSALRIRIRRLKGSLSGVHPLQPDEVKSLRSYLRHRTHDSPFLFTSNRQSPISRRMLDVLTKHYGALVQIPEEKRHFHALKHTCATHLLEVSGDVRFVQDWVGHARIENTVRYAHLVSSSRDAAAKRHFQRLPQF